jgi:iron complex outermembrane receptor protein
MGSKLINVQQAYRSTLKKRVGVVLKSIPVAAAGIAILLSAQISHAQLEEIIVTAQKRTESLRDVPISVATMSGDELDAVFSAGGDILALAATIPGLHAESSNGRLAPRFYLRGIGNTDFDLAASQPVSIVMDDVVMENVILKSFPLFDLERIETIRGPQGTLFGRNTTAGVIKFESRRPTEDTVGFLKLSMGELGTQDIEGAVGGALSQNLSARLSVLSQRRDHWVTNKFNDENDAFKNGDSKLGGFNDTAARIQLAWQPSDSFSALFLAQTRDMTGTATLFRANVLDVGSNELNSNYVRDEVYFDGGDNNPQGITSTGYTAKLDWSPRDSMTLTSITSYQEAADFSRGDIDGGARYPDDSTFPGPIPFDAVTEDQADTTQFTQELRLASNNEGPLNWQVGGFYFDSDLEVVTVDAFFGATTVDYTNTTWALFGQLSYDLTDKLTLIGGLRYTDDKKGFTVGDQNVDGFALVIDAAEIQDYDPVSVQDDAPSWELSANYLISGDTSIFGRVSNGFRAQTIRGRTIAFEGVVSVADKETVTSYEMGLKSDFFNGTARLNLDVFYYTIDDIQLTGRATNTAISNSLMNADKAVGQGFTIDFTYAPTDNLRIAAGYGYTDTELQDDLLSVGTCAFCTVLDPIDSSGQALIDGNRLERSPLSTINASIRYSLPVSTGEFYVFSDIAVQGETHLQAYEAVEYVQDDLFELGLRLAYINDEHGYEVAVFGRNITDEEYIKGALTFNNMTAFTNLPRIWGVQFAYNF